MRLFIVLTATAIVLFCVWFDYSVLAEYYGQGPPYYGRSVNMDKWRNPILFLCLINCIAFAFIALMIKGCQWAFRHGSRNG